MSARLFLTTWSLVGNEVHNAIVDYVDTLPDMGITCMMFYGDADANGLPDFPLVLVLVHSPQLSGAQIENAGANIAGAHLIPSIPWNTQLSSLPLAKLQAAQMYLTNNGIDTSSLTLQNTFGDLVHLVVNTIAPLHGHPGLKKWALANLAEFG